MACDNDQDTFPYAQKYQWRLLPWLETTHSQRLPTGQQATLSKLLQLLVHEIVLDTTYGLPFDTLALICPCVGSDKLGLGPAGDALQY